MSDCCSASAKAGAVPEVLACPVSGVRCKQVNMLTVKSLVRELPLVMPNTRYYYCEDQECDAVYFPLDPESPIFYREELNVRVGAKEKADPIPVCYCFGFSRKDIQYEIAETGCSTVGERIAAEVKAGNCACEVKNPSGKCCLGSVAQIARDYMKNLQGAATKVAG
jgi:hypothetical protein